MSTGYKFLRFIKTKRLLILDWIDRVILGNRKLTISVVPVFIEGKDPRDERIEFFISKESDDLEENNYEDDAYPQEGATTASGNSQAIDAGGIRGIEGEPAGI